MRPAERQRAPTKKKVLFCLFFCAVGCFLFWLWLCFFCLVFWRVVPVVLLGVTRDFDCSGLCTGPFPIHFCAPFAAGLGAHLIRLFSVSLQHATEHVE